MARMAGGSTGPQATRTRGADGTARPRVARGPRSDSDAQLRAFAMIPARARPLPHRLYPYGGPGVVIEAGRLCACYGRGAYRVTEVLAVVGAEVLVELEYSPSGLNELRLVRLDGRRMAGQPDGFRRLRYEEVPTPLLEAMLAQEVEWHGRGRGGRMAPSACEVLARRHDIPPAPTSDAEDLLTGAALEDELAALIFGDAPAPAAADG